MTTNDNSEESNPKPPKESPEPKPPDTPIDLRPREVKRRNHAFGSPEWIMKEIKKAPPTSPPQEKSTDAE